MRTCVCLCGCVAGYKYQVKDAKVGGPKYLHTHVCLCLCV